MTYVTCQRQDDVTYAKMCLPIPSNRYDEAIFAIGIIKKVTGEKRQGGGIHPPGRPRVNRERCSASYVLG